MSSESLIPPFVALVIDPHEDTRALYAHAFESVGWSILEADDGATGLGLALTKRPAAIVSELRLPMLDGPRVITILRSDRNTASLPIVVVTADVRGMREAWRVGANAVIAKPVTPDRILTSVQSEVQRRSALTVRSADVQQSRLPGTSRPGERRKTLSRRMGRYATTAPPNPPPVVRCERCDVKLRYVRSQIGGVNDGAREQWDYLECPSGCGVYQYRHRGRRLQRVE